MTDQTASKIAREIATTPTESTQSHQDAPGCPSKSSVGHHIPNHTIDPKTGFLESLAYDDSFNGKRKIQFLKSYRLNDMRLWLTCQELGMRSSTVVKHRQIDKVFDLALKEIEDEYIETIEVIGRKSALNPYNWKERTWILERLRPEKYSRYNSTSPTQIVINIDPDFMEKIEAKHADEMVFEMETVKTEAVDSQRV